MNLSILSKIWGMERTQKINTVELPSQGYFYPENLEIRIEKGNIDDQSKYHHGLNNSNIFGIIDTIKEILRKRINLKPNSFKFESIRAIDIFFIFIEFVKFSTDSPVIFNGIEFCSSNFIYFDFTEYNKNYDEILREFNFNGWRYSLPSIGIETSLNHFSYELLIKGKSEKYQNSNYNLIYFQGNKLELNYKEMINLIETFDDLDLFSKNEINSIVEKFSKTGLYFLISPGRTPIRINPNMLKEVWI